MSYPHQQQPQHANQYQQPYAQQQQQWTPPAPRKHKSSKLHWFAYPAVALVFLAIGIAAGGSGSSDTGTTGSSSSAAADTDTANTKAAKDAAPKKAAPQPVTIDGDGTYEVGPDIKPGKYVTKKVGELGCYWARLKSTDGDFASIIANGNTNGQTTVTIKKTDKAFQTQGCGTWTKR